MKRWFSIAIAGLVFGAAALPAAQVGLIKIDGAIGPATANYIARALDLAADQNDECLIIELNTPGGLAIPWTTSSRSFMPREFRWSCTFRRRARWPAARAFTSRWRRTSR